MISLYVDRLSFLTQLIRFPPCSKSDIWATDNQRKTISNFASCFSIPIQRSNTRFRIIFFLAINLVFRLLIGMKKGVKRPNLWLNPN